MLATFWEKLFAYADEMKKEHGVKSIQYQTVHDVENLLQEAYDECNRIKDVEVLDARPKDANERYIFHNLPEVKFCEDKDGNYYVMDGQHFETAAEVIDFIVKSYLNKHKNLNARYNNKFKQACVTMATRLYNDTKRDFMKSLGYEEGEFYTNSSCVIRDTKGSEEE